VQVARSEPSFSSNAGLQRPAFAAPPVVLALERPAIESVSAVATPTEQVTDPTPEPALAEEIGIPTFAPAASEQVAVPQSVTDTSADASSAADSPSPPAGAIAGQPAATLPASTADNGAGDGVDTIGTTGDHGMAAAAGNGGAGRRLSHAQCVLNAVHISSLSHHVPALLCSNVKNRRIKRGSKRRIHPEPASVLLWTSLMKAPANCSQLARLSCAPHVSCNL